MRILLVVLAWPLIILTIIVSFDWIRGEFFTSPRDKNWTDRVRPPSYLSVGAHALTRFSELSETDRNSVIRNLESNLITTEQWLAGLQQSEYRIVCLGEDHEETTRQFLAEQFFQRFTTDVLLLEATSAGITRIAKNLDTGKNYVPLLDADIAKIIRVARSQNPNLILGGIEETKRQKKTRERQDHPSFRDDSIVSNFWHTYRPGKRHVILFGALHCTNQPNWLFERVRGMAPRPVAEKMLNVRVIGDHQDGLLEAFVFFIDEIGVERSDFVIPNTSSLHPLIFEWFALLTPQTLGRFHTLVVFRM